MFTQENAPKSGPLGVKAFDDLPDSANVPVKVVGALFGCSTATVWRWVRSGHLVAPHRFGLRSTRWSVGELRAALNKAKGGDACL
jgi:predicted DNA-binding transcriptional regulator AlpA